MLDIASLTVNYGRIPALRQLGLEVKQGEIVGLIGPNGAGKSTTLNTIAGLQKPSEGTIHFEGASIAGMAPERIVALGVALVPEGRQILTTLTVEENLTLGQSAGRRSRRRVPSLQSIFERFPVLSDYNKRMAGTLSGGEQQQLAIARSLLTAPKLLMLDEPSLGLAPQLVERLFDALLDLREDGLTILIVEQKGVETLELADRTYILRSGELAFSGTAEQIAARGDLIDDYLGTGATDHAAVRERVSEQQIGERTTRHNE